MTRFDCGCEQHVKGMRTDHSPLKERTVWKLCEKHDRLLEANCEIDHFIGRMC